MRVFKLFTFHVLTAGRLCFIYQLVEHVRNSSKPQQTFSGINISNTAYKTDFW